MKSDTVTPLPLSILFTIFALCAILGLAWVVLKFFASTYKSRVANGEIQIRSTYALGARQHLYVVNFRDKDYFLGVTAEHIKLIDSSPEKPNLKDTE